MIYGKVLKSGVLKITKIKELIPTNVERFYCPKCHTYSVYPCKNIPTGEKRLNCIAACGFETWDTKKIRQALRGETKRESKKTR